MCSNSHGVDEASRITNIIAITTIKNRHWQWLPSLSPLPIVMLASAGYDDDGVNKSNDDEWECNDNNNRNYVSITVITCIMSSQLIC